MVYMVLKKIVMFIENLLNYINNQYVNFYSW